MYLKHPTDFVGQFLFGEVPLPPRPGTRTRRLGSLELQLFEGCMVASVSDARGKAVGLLLGHPVDLEKGIVVRDHLILNDVLGTDVDGFVEANIYRLGGSFVFILEADGIRRLYLDAGGTMQAVYDPETGRVAATTPLLLSQEEYRDRFQAEIYKRLNIPRDGWFPAGLTAHAGIGRLLCNHFLDLRRWTQHRHWPREQISVTSDPEAACARIAATTRTQIDALLTEGNVALALTAGNETRLLLAICRDIADRLDFITVSGPPTALDVSTASELAKRFGLRHHPLPIVRANPDEAADWHARTGHTVGGSNMHTHPSVVPLESYAFAIGGMGGEIGRGFFWRKTDTAHTRLDAEGLTARFGMPQRPEVTAAVRDWLPSAAEFDPFQQLDLAYLELRLGCWAFASSYATPRIRTIHPLISRSSFESMMSLPPDWRANNRMIRTIIQNTWPALLDIPINAYGDYRDTLALAQKALREPHLVLKVLRKRFG